MRDRLAIARNPAAAFRQVCAIRSSDHGQKTMIGTAACWLHTKAMPMLALGIPSRGFPAQITLFPAQITLLLLHVGNRMCYNINVAFFVPFRDIEKGKVFCRAILIFIRLENESP